LCSVLLNKYHYGDKIKKNEMGRACSTYGKRKGAYRVWQERPEGKNHLQDPDVDGRIILKRIFEKLYVGGIDWIILAHNVEHINLELLLKAVT
jgi:hypothetical protein